MLARELDTISEYEGYAAEAEDERLRAFFQHLADEEKEHVAEALALIEQRDPVQKSQRTDVDIRPEHFAGEKKESAAEAIKPAADKPEEAIGDESPAPAKVLITTGPMTGRGQFTVGSLKKRR